MDRYDVDTCIEVLLEHVETRDQAADILDQLESIMFNEDGCFCCNSLRSLVRKDDQNNAFIDSNGEITVMVKDHFMRFNANYCPHCGRRFNRVG